MSVNNYIAKSCTGLLFCKMSYWTKGFFLQVIISDHIFVNCQVDHFFAIQFVEILFCKLFMGCKSGQSKSPDIFSGRGNWFVRALVAQFLLDVRQKLHPIHKTFCNGVLGQATHWTTLNNKGYCTEHWLRDGTCWGIASILWGVDGGGKSGASQRWPLMAVRAAKTQLRGIYPLRPHLRLYL